MPLRNSAELDNKGDNECMKQKLLYKIIFGVLSLGFLINVPSAKTSAMDLWFDSYGKISWQEEVWRLRNFEVSLRRNPEMIGYIAFNWSSKKEFVEMKKRAERARKYLVYERKMDKSRIIIVKGGKREKPRIILQPVDKGAPQRDFS